MAGSETLIGIASSLLSERDSERYREQWLADLRDAHEVGLTRPQVVRGAFAFAAHSFSGRRVRADLRAQFSWTQPLVLAILFGIFAFVVFGHSLLGGHAVVLRDQFDVFSELMNTPFVQLMPVFVLLLTCARFARDREPRWRLGNRTITVRSEKGPIRKLLIGCATAFVVFFAWTLLGATIAFALWPAIGNPSVNPSVYNLTIATAVTDSLTRTTYSQLLAGGPLLYAIGYAAWVGFAAATYCALGMAALLLVRFRILALTLVVVLYAGQVVAAEYAGRPMQALTFSVAPFGLTQQPLLVGAAPVLVLALLVAVFWAFWTRRLVRREIQQEQLGSPTG